MKARSPGSHADRSGTASFFVNDAAGAQRDTLARDPLGQGKPITVPVTTLDDEIYGARSTAARARSVGFLKIDAQGYACQLSNSAPSQSLSLC